MSTVLVMYEGMLKKNNELMNLSMEMLVLDQFCNKNRDIDYNNSVVQCPH